MLQVISNISSIITAVTFIVYLVGRFIRISFSKYNTYEKFTVYEREKTGRDIEEETNNFSGVCYHNILFLSRGEIDGGPA